MKFELVLDIREKSHITQVDIGKIEMIYTSFLLEKRVIPQTVLCASVSLAFIDLADMIVLNNAYRQIPEGTDVLSFPFWETEAGLFSPPLDWDFLPLGDIIVCPEIIKQNAKDQNKQVLNEMVLVIFHGLLHLIGFDHNNIEEKQHMWKEQNDMLSEYFTSKT